MKKAERTLEEKELGEGRRGGKWERKAERNLLQTKRGGGGEEVQEEEATDE